MKKPSALIALIEELRNENNESTATTRPESSAKIFVDDDAVEHDDPITLSKQDCECLLSTRTSVESMVEALGSPQEASVELHEIDLAADALDALEKAFIAVDET